MSYNGRVTTYSKEEANDFPWASVIAAGTTLVAGGIYAYGKRDEGEEEKEFVDHVKNFLDGVGKAAPLATVVYQVVDKIQDEVARRRQTNSLYPAGTIEQFESDEGETGDTFTNNDWSPRDVCQTCSEPGCLSAQGSCPKKKMANPNIRTVILEIQNELIRIEKDEKKNSTDIIENFVKKTIIDAMKNADPLFKLLFREVYHSGSFYDGMRCGTADEFDLNLIMDIQLLESILLFDEVKVEPGFLKVGLTTDVLDSRKPDWIKNWPTFLKTLTEKDRSNGRLYLMPFKVRQWFQSILQRANVQHLSYPGIISVNLKQSGPAWTLQIKTRNHKSVIDVDLVPAFIFKCSNLINYNEIKVVLEKNGWMNQNFFIIPKPSKTDGQQVMRFWRLDFHDIERIIIQKEPYSKNVVRLVKVFRDNNAVLENLSSYSLKTVVMLMIRDKRVVWTETNLPDLFLMTLKSLRDRLKEGMIPYYFHHQCDVLWSLNSQRRKEMSTWLDKKIKILEESKDKQNNRDIWRPFFGLK